jgi:hypothetical protein
MVSGLGLPSFLYLAQTWLVSDEWIVVGRVLVPIGIGILTLALCQALLSRKCLRIPVGEAALFSVLVFSFYLICANYLIDGLFIEKTRENYARQEWLSVFVEMPLFCLSLALIINRMNSFYQKGYFFRKYERE